MLAQNNDNIKEASTTVYQLSQEERIRMECEAREDYHRTQRGIQKKLEQSAAQIESLTAEKEALTAEINKLQNWIKRTGIALRIFNSFRQCPPSALPPDTLPQAESPSRPHRTPDDGWDVPHLFQF